MPRYVLLRHDCPDDYRDGPHWDLMLELGESLLTWSLAELPAAWQEEKTGPSAVAAEQLPNHRLAYLDYEGEVAGGRGKVTRHAFGEQALSLFDNHRLEVQAISGELHGNWTLTHKEGANWRLTVDPKSA